MCGHKDVKKTDDEQLEQNWCNKVLIADSEIEFKAEFIKMSSDFEFMWDGHGGRTNTAKHRIKLSPADAKPAHSAPYWAGSEARNFGKNKFEKNVVGWRLRAGSDQMGSIKSICDQEGWLLMFLRRLPQVKRSYEGRSLPDITHGQMYPFLGKAVFSLHCMQTGGTE